MLASCMVRPRLSFVLLVALIATSMLLALFRPAHACGAFVGARGNEVTVPYLAAEQVLIVWDKDTEIEDFVREARFEKANKVFGFIVPTPSVPEVFAVEDKPFPALRAAYPYVPPPGGGGAGSGKLGGVGRGAPAGVVVLSEQRIGSFRAFVLGASDAKGMDQWLDTNGFATTEQTRPWIAHYVALRFFFVAFRYEPAAETASAGMTSESVRIRFKTPHPYYPYQEPVHAAADASVPSPRLLSVWLVTQEPMFAVARHEPTMEDQMVGAGPWQRPWGVPSPYERTREEVASKVGSLGALLPPRVFVQAFEDRRSSREGFGDVLLVPSKPQAFTDADIAARTHLLPLLDPSLASPGGINVVSVPPQKCSATPGQPADATPIALSVGALAVALLLARRRRARFAAGLVVLLLVMGCGKTRRGTPPTTTVAVDESARRSKVLALLRGEVPENELPLAPQPDFVVRAPAGQVTIGPATFVGPAVSGVDRVLAGLRSRVRSCYQTGLVNDPRIKGSLEITFVVAPNGEPTPSVSKNEGLPLQVAECTRAAVGRATFSPPEGGGKTTAKIAIRFEPPDS
jgi:MYXO-CTERM domain-containing protein